MDKQYYVYILTNKWGTTLYTGITNNLARRVEEHKMQTVDGFAKRYNLAKLAYYAICETADAAISEEKRIKGGSRKDKVELIQTMNPTWRDLSDDL